MSNTRLDPHKFFIGSLHDELNKPRLTDALHDILGCTVVDVHMPERQDKAKPAYAFVTFACTEQAKWAVEVLAGSQDERLTSNFVKAPVVTHVGARGYKTR